MGQDEWNITRVSKVEAIFNKFMTRVNQPLGVVVVGIDGVPKERATTEIMRQMGDFARFYAQIPELDTLKDAFADGLHAAVVVLDSKQSADHQARHELVKLLEAAGAKTTVMFFIDAKKIPVASSQLTPEAAEYNKQVVSMMKHRPTPEGVDYLVTIPIDPPSTL